MVAAIYINLKTVVHHAKGQTSVTISQKPQCSPSSSQVTNPEQAGPSLTMDAVNTPTGHQLIGHCGKGRNHHALGWQVEPVETDNRQKI